MYHAQHKAAPGSQDQPYMQPWPPYAGQPQPPARPRKPRNRIVLRVVLLAFIAQWPLWFLVFMIGPPVGTVAAGCAFCASGIVVLGAIYGCCYGVYRLVRWALGL